MNTNDSQQVITATISKNRNVHVQSLDKDNAFENAVYAINWFDTRRSWLYNLYNFFASFAVKKVGGIGIFKGRINQELYGKKIFKREMLLIVRYPSVKNFIKLVEIRYFQLVSLLRISAVKNFTFGFTKQIGDSPHLKQKWQKDKVYVIHHYKGNDDISNSVSDVMRRFGVEVFYTGRINALLYSGDWHQPKDQVPCIMDGVILLQADSLTQIANSIDDPSYKTIILQTQSSFIASLTRIF